MICPISILQVNHHRLQSTARDEKLGYYGSVVYLGFQKGASFFFPTVGVASPIRRGIYIYIHKIKTGILNKKIKKTFEWNQVSRI